MLILATVWLQEVFQQVLEETFQLELPRLAKSRTASSATTTILFALLALVASIYSIMSVCYPHKLPQVWELI